MSGRHEKDEDKSPSSAAFFDHIVKSALRENIPQIVFLGAGYDSRP